MKQALVASLYSVLFLFNFFLAEKIRKHLAKFQEISRKVVHITSGLIALTFPYYIHSHWIVLGLVTAFTLLMIETKQRSLLKSVHEVGRKSYGTLYFPLAIYLIYLLARDTPAIYFISILVMTVSDAFAALIGKKYGTIKFEIEGNIKSLEGSITFFFLTFLCILLPLLLMTDIGKLEVILISFIISSILTGFEAISPSGSDNIIVPFGTCFLLIKMVYLPLPLIIEDLYLLLATIVLTAPISLFRPSGLIGMTLINYSALALKDFNWFFPLYLGELLVFLIAIFTYSKQEREKFPFRVLFYLGVIPTTLIFIANMAKNESIIFIPYLVSIVSQIPLSFSYYLQGIRNYKTIFAVLFVTISSVLLYFRDLNIKLILMILLSSIFVFVLNLIIHKKCNPEKVQENEYRIRFVSTVSGCFLVILLGVMNVY